MDTAVVTGAFTLGGVVIGGALEWARGSIADRRKAAAERDQLVAALDAACIRLMTEARLWRGLDTSMSKLRQLGFGLLGELPDLPPTASSASLSASLPDVAYTVIRWLGAGVSKSLLHQTPVALTESMRATLLPLLSEITTMAVRLSMVGDKAVKDATDRLGSAAGAVLENVTEPPAQFAQREEEVQAAIGQLRRARDAADAHLWRRRAMRRRIGPAAGDAPTATSRERRALH